MGKHLKIRMASSIGRPALRAALKLVLTLQQPQQPQNARGHSPKITACSHPLPNLAKAS
jgi:hypothetical protein